MKINVALAQVEPATRDTAANLATFDRSIERAAGQGADLVIFPELAHRYRPNIPILRDLRAGMYEQLREVVESSID